MAGIAESSGLSRFVLLDPAKRLLVQASQENFARFQRVFDASIKHITVDPDKVLKRIEDRCYDCDLFMNEISVQAAACYDKKPFQYQDISQALRVHFLHGGGESKLQLDLLIFVVSRAIDKLAKALIFPIPNTDRNMRKLLERYGFTIHSKDEGSTVFKCESITALQKALKLDSVPSAQGSEAISVHRSLAIAAPDVLPIPHFYQPMTLMKKYVNFIQRGQKTVEGRINAGSFYVKKLHRGDGFRFFYKQNESDDVYVTVTEVKEFDTFEEMLKYYGYTASVPDARSLQHAVSIYAGIRSYPERERASGVVALKLRLDPTPRKRPHQGDYDLGDAQANDYNGDGPRKRNHRHLNSWEKN